MANLTETSAFDATIYQLETTDPVVGGVGGISNLQPRQLANRTRYLKDHVDALEALAGDLASKAYVQAELEKLDNKQSARAATTAPITLAGIQTVDGVALIGGDRVLVKDLAAQAQNGIYVVAAGGWSRATDANDSAEVTPGLEITIEEGTVNADTRWRLVSNASVVLGTSALVFQNITAGLAPLDSPQFINDPRAPTAPQFDDDTTLATTAFVQRALGSKSGVLNFGASTALNASHVGKFITFGGSGLVATLPPSTGLKIGSMLRLGNTSASQSYTVQPAAGDSLYALGNVTPRNIILLGGESADFVLVGTNTWYAMGGSQVAFTGGFLAVPGTISYYKLPNGIIVQHGNYAASAAGEITVSFPIAFPNAISSLVVSAQAAGAGPGIWATYSGRNVNGFFAGAWVNQTTRANATCDFIATGY